MRSTRVNRTFKALKSLQPEALKLRMLQRELTDLGWCKVCITCGLYGVYKFLYVKARREVV